MIFDQRYDSASGRGNAAGTQLVMMLAISGAAGVARQVIDGQKTDLRKVLSQFRNTREFRACH